MSDFVFATVQYESGDWDSAPLVPANVIDTIARYGRLSAEHLRLRDSAWQEREASKQSRYSAREQHQIIEHLRHAAALPMAGQPDREITSDREPAASAGAQFSRSSSAAPSYAARAEYATRTG